MLYLIRHGETDWNIERRLQGHTDIPLNQNGIKTMTEAGKRLKEQHFQVDRIVSSPLKRAKETARVIAEQIGYSEEILCDDGLMERSFGLAEGVSLLEHPDLSDEKYGVETIAAFRERVETVLRKYQSDEEQTWLLVTHGAFIMAALDLLSGRPLCEEYLSPPAQGNPIQVTEKNGKVLCEYVLQTSPSSDSREDR